MAQAGWAKRVLARVLVAVWRRIDPPVIPARHLSMNPADNLQRSMNLVMPLADTTAVARAQLVQTLSSAVQEVMTGLNTTGIVHFARFSIVDGNLCMFSIYDGDFSNYIRDFIATIGSAFDALLDFIKDRPKLPVEDNVDEFIDWVDAHDSLQLPESVTDLSDNLLTLPRQLTLLLDACPDTQLFVYRAYPGYSVAQVRQALSIGW
jgi:hypothetical protein